MSRSDPFAGTPGEGWDPSGSGFYPEDAHVNANWIHEAPQKKAYTRWEGSAGYSNPIPDAVKGITAREMDKKSRQQERRDQILSSLVKHTKPEDSATILAGLRYGRGARTDKYRSGHIPIYFDKDESRYAAYDPIGHAISFSEVGFDKLSPEFIADTARHEGLHALLAEFNRDKNTLKNIGIEELYDLTDMARRTTHSGKTSAYTDFKNRNWDPRMKTASEQGSWDKWAAYQRELPPEEYGGAVSAHGKHPWGPATVNYSYIDDVETPISTGSQAPVKASIAGFNKPYVYQQTGLLNWPMADQHAFTAAQSAKYGDPNALFNMSAAMLAHPSSNIRSIHEQGLPDKALKSIESYLRSNPWQGAKFLDKKETFSEAKRSIKDIFEKYGIDTTLLWR